MTSVNCTGSVSRSGRCGAISAGILLKRQDRTGERAGHLHGNKVEGSSGSEWQSLKMGLFGLGWLFLDRKRLVSTFNPSHPVMRGGF